MRLKIDENKVKTHGAGPMTNARMGIRHQDMHVIINILRSKMYSNPIRTIIQEVSSNARDAHRELGVNDRPIRIKLPDRHDNSFFIQDFGVGVDPDRMENVFINYGASTKRDTDEQTGGFGLGAKSPFSYADQFGIVSVTPDEDGKLMLRQYAAILDGKDGFVRQIEERPAKANEERGTKIVIPVKAEDFNAFRKWTIETCKYWSVKPEVVSKTDKVEWPKYDVDHEGKDKNWLIYKKTNNGWSYRSQDNEFNRPKAVVDGIPYPLDKSSIEDSNDYTLNSDINNLWNYPVLLKFETGEVNLTANREELDYSDKDTPVMIRKRFKVIIGELQEKFGKEIKNCKNLIEANVKWNEIKSGYSNLVRSVKWNGIDITGSPIGTQSVASLHVFQRDATNNDGLGKKSSSSIDFYNKNMIVAYDHSDSKMPSRAKIGYLFDQDPNLHTVFALKFKEVSEIYDNHDVFKAKPSLKKKGTPKDLWDWYSKKYHVDKMAPVDLDSTPRRKRKRVAGGSGGAGTVTPVVAIKDYNSSAYTVRDHWSNGDEDLEKGKGTLLWLKGYDAYTDKNFDTCIGHMDLDYVEKDLGIELHAVIKRYAEKTGKGWITLEDRLVQEYDKFKKQYDSVKAIDCQKPMRDCSYMRDATIKSAFKVLPLSSVARTLYEKWEGMDSKANDKRTAANKCNGIRLILMKIDKDKYSKKYNELSLATSGSKDYQDIFKSRYTMIFHIPNWQLRNMRPKDLVEYIEAMDKHLGNKHL